MEIIKLIEYLQEIVETAHKVPITGKIMVSRKEVTNTIEEILNCLPEELKKAQWLIEEKDRILNDALKQADQLKQENLKILKRKIENHDITKEARERGEEIIALAQKDAKAMRIDARDYVSELLNQLEQQIENKKEQMLINAKNNFEQFISETDQTFNGKVKIIKNNIEELKNIE